MKKVLSLICLVVIVAIFSSCLTSPASVLSAQSMQSTEATINPSLTQLETGIHPYISAAYCDKDTSRNRLDSIEKTKAGAITLGFNYHKSLEEKKEFLPFFGVGLRASIVSYDPRFLKTEYDAIEMQGIRLEKNLIDYSAELIAKPGFIIKLNRILMSVYLLGIAKYEDGSYASLRQNLDGIEDMYNFVDNPWSYGFGFGYDFQFGSPKKWDIGITFELSDMHNSTQSTIPALLKDDSSFTFRGDTVYTKPSFTFGPYVDYKKIRFSLSSTNFETSEFKVTWRF